MDTAQRLREIFDYIDETANEQQTAEVRIQDKSNNELTIRAGGPGVLSWPAVAPFEAYEVFMDHDPARFWNRYSDDLGLLYARVPKLLVTHHIVRHGGVANATFHVEQREQIGVVKLQLLASDKSYKAVMEAISNLSGVRLTSSDFVTG